MIGCRCVAVAAVTAAMLMGGTSAQAQVEQTVEGAQKFLEMTLPGNVYEPGHARDSASRAIESWRGNYEGSGRLAYLSENSKITEARTLARCTSAIKADLTRASMKTVTHWREQGFPKRHEETHSVPAHLSSAIAGLPQGFAWGDVTSVEHNGRRVFIKLRDDGSDNGAAIWLSSESMAACVAYAMEFLRVQCDPAAATGF